MKRIYWLLTLFCSVSVFQSTFAQQARTVLFDDDWRFVKGDLEGAEVSTYIDDRWRKIALPHDWSIEDLANPRPDSISGPFHKGSIGGTATGFTVGGTGWYRKKFITPPAARNKSVTIHFDGVYMNSDVWLNGHHLGNHPYGYTPFYYELTPYLKPAGQENVLAVRVRNEGKNSKKYVSFSLFFLWGFAPKGFLKPSRRQPLRRQRRVQPIFLPANGKLPSPEPQLETPSL